MMIKARGFRGILLEAVLGAAAGLMFAFVANQISPKGLMLSRNYFPSGTNNVIRSVAAVPAHEDASTNSSSIEQLIAAQIKKEGFQLIDNPQALGLFHESESNHGIVFIDARDEESYRTAHIPRARQFDPYRPEKCFPNVLPVCQKAEQIVVYCNGGDCDDSQTAALLLKAVGISPRILLIYGGGITDWTNRNLPVQSESLSDGKAKGTTP